MALYANNDLVDNVNDLINNEDNNNSLLEIEFRLDSNGCTAPCNSCNKTSNDNGNNAIHCNTKVGSFNVDYGQ